VAVPVLVPELNEMMPEVKYFVNSVLSGSLALSQPELQLATEHWQFDCILQVSQEISAWLKAKLGKSNITKVKAKMKRYFDFNISP
jgi:hypothetical protein